ncbi:MAG: hypothetical protein J6N32_10850, partial [Clostridia bacterium]|nr:hypothetical protein [Clostridia bacterium]
MKLFENRYGEVRLRQDPDFRCRMGYIDEVRYDQIQLHKGILRTPWLTPFVLFEENCMSADRTDAKRERR